MNAREAGFSAIFFVLLLLSLEFLLRIALYFFGYPFITPGDYLDSGFYPIINEVGARDVRKDNNVRNVLILGGSVISKPWSHMESRLDTILQERYGNAKKFAFYNIAVAGHTSLDNVIKYGLLKDSRFDLVIYYEAINENRANCIAPEDFRSDYSHIKWYADIYRLQNHPEINYTIIPYACDLLASAVWDKLTHRIYASQDGVGPDMAKFGSDIKTAAAYERNVGGIISLARKRGDKLLLVKYASYFPEGVRLTGDKRDMTYYAGCNYASWVAIWGDAENVKKGILVHNQILTRLAKENQTYFFDMAANMPQEAKFFCDVCHVSELGAQNFAHKLAEYIADKKLLE